MFSTATFEIDSNGTPIIGGFCQIKTIGVDGISESFWMELMDGGDFGGTVVDK
jgi:hypothetical protein